MTDPNNPNLSAPSGPDMDEGALERAKSVVAGWVWDHVDGIDGKTLKGEWITSLVERVHQALSTPSPTLTPDADALAARLERIAYDVLNGAAAEDVLTASRRLASHDRLVARLIKDANEEQARADEACAKADASPSPDLLKELVEALRIAAQRFRVYEQLHLAKDTDEGRDKAVSNGDMAALCEAVLLKAKGVTP